MELLNQYAPFLATYGPFLLAGAVGYILAILSNRAGRKKRNPASPETLLQHVPRSGKSGFIMQGPQDQDNYVLMEDTVRRTPQQIKSDPDENDDIDHTDFEDSEDEQIQFRPQTYSTDTMIQRTKDFYYAMNKRRSVRFFSDKDIPLEVIENIIHTAGTSPSGAHTEPWMFIVISDKKTKSAIREIIEAEEKINYERRMGDKWVNDLKPLKTTWKKPYLEVAPYLVIVFKQSYGITSTGQKKTHYYSEISISIATGLLLAAVQNAGLVTLTSTPMNAGPQLRTLLRRPANEKVIMLLPIGYPAEDATVPDLNRKPIQDIMIHVK